MRRVLKHGAVALTASALITGGVIVLDASSAAADPKPTAVVSLGDSAISGEGAGSYESGTDGPADYCHRSRVAQIQKTTVPGTVARINLACSGAASSDIRINGTTHYTEGPQADRLRAVLADYHVTTVVLQVGANDDPAFADSVLSCVKAWLNPFIKGCATTLSGQWPGRVAAMAPKVESAVNDVRTVFREAGYADGDYQFVLQSYASPFTERMNSVTHAFDGCPIKIADAQWARATAVPQLAAALRGVAQRTGVRFLDLGRAAEGHEACTTASSQKWMNGLVVDYSQILKSGITAHIVQQSFHPNATGHAQLGRCLTEFVAATSREGACLVGSDGNLHATASVTAATAGV